MCMGGNDKNLGLAAMYTAQADIVLGQKQVSLAEKKNDQDAQLQREYLDLIKANQPIEERIQTAQADSMDLALQRQREVQYPLEDQIIDEAKNYDSAGRIATEAGKADSAVVQAYDKATAGAQRDMLRSGLNPNSAKALALRENASLSQAATAANASTTAAEAVKGKGFAMRMDAAALGRNLAPNSVASADSSLRAGQAQASGMAGLIQSANQSFDSTMRGFGSASQTMNNSASNLASISNAQTSAAASKQAGVGSAVGTAVGAYASSSAGGSAISSGLSYLGSLAVSY